MDNGKIIEQGTYQVCVICDLFANLSANIHPNFQDLVANGSTFSRLMEEYGSLEAESENEEIKDFSKRKSKKTQGANDDGSEEGGSKRGSGALMQVEERNTGAVTWSTYANYLRFAGGVIWGPFILLILTLTQGAQGMVLVKSFLSFIIFLWRIN